MYSKIAEFVRLDRTTPHPLQSLQTDYAAMKNMIFGIYPSWEMIIQKLTELQRNINDVKLHPGS